MNLLFICSRNRWRSPTAEAIYRQLPGIEARSAGTEPAARNRLSARLIDWADVIFVMEQKHKTRMKENFPAIMTGKKIIVLDIPDEYQYMDPELIEMLRDSVDGYLDRL